MGNDKMDLSTPEKVRAAFARMRPDVPVPLAGARPRQPSPEEHDKLRQFGQFVRDALTALFVSDPAPEAPRAPSTWAPEQRALLEEIAATPQHLHLNAGDLGRALERIGAVGLGPSNDGYLARYVGQAPSTALERVIDDKPLWLWLRLHLMDKIAPEAWLDAARGLTVGERLELVKLATNNAYQLSRRWPLPSGLTTEIEREDATRLYDAVLPLLEPIPTPVCEAHLTDEAKRAPPALGLALLLAVVLAERSVPFSEGVEDTLVGALELFSNVTFGRRLLEALHAAQRLALVERLELTYYDATPWAYLPVLDQPTRAKLVVVALSNFRQGCTPDVATQVRSVIATLDGSGREALREVAARNVPNAKLIEDGLAAVQ